MTTFARLVAGAGAAGAILWATAWFHQENIQATQTTAALKAALTELGHDVSADVADCHDGDTCRVSIAGGLWLLVRLHGIAEPDVGRGNRVAGQPFGAAARDTLNRMVAGKSVALRQLDLDQYNRPIVEIRAAAANVNLRLVNDGLAEVYRQATRRLDLTPYLAAESDARSARRGIWGQDSYASPSEYRAARRRAKAPGRD